MQGKGRVGGLRRPPQPQPSGSPPQLLFPQEVNAWGREVEDGEVTGKWQWGGLGHEVFRDKKWLFVTADVHKSFTLRAGMPVMDIAGACIQLCLLVICGNPEGLPSRACP